ncbi:MAG: hypothetical protein O2798_09450 [Chloroflexi bacterium]|nr:hypothetical protein [Chloroflexota bacterium]MDA1241052.1 hypothetical protein [Chloroflexota bacterium]
MRRALFAVTLAALIAVGCTGTGDASPTASPSPPPTPATTPEPLPTETPVPPLPPFPPFPDDLSPVALQVIEAVERGDTTNLWVILQTTVRLCTDEGLGSLPCEPDDPVGTKYEVFPTASCQGYWTNEPREVVNLIVEMAGAPYAIARIGPDPEWAVAEDYPYGSLVVVFSPRLDARMTDAVAVYLTDEGIVRTQFGCRRADQFLEPGVEEAPFEVIWRTNVPDRTN